jgi:hypothetical protein
MTNITSQGPIVDQEGWFKSSYSNASATCVEVKFVPNGTAVRDSKDQRSDRPLLTLSAEGWLSFLSTITR